MKVDFRASKETEVQVPINKNDNDKCLEIHELKNVLLDSSN